MTLENPEVVLSPESGALETAATQLRVVGKFFKVVTDGLEGLGPTYAGSQSNRVPIANIRFGWAFHQDPQDPSATRFPATEGTFVYDLADPAVQKQLAYQRDVTTDVKSAVVAMLDAFVEQAFALETEVGEA